MEAALTLSDAATATLTPDELCRRYAPSVCRFAGMIAGSSSDADDLAQDALLRAVRAIHSYDPSKGSPEAWLWRIVVNAGRDSARRRERTRWIVERLAFTAPRESRIYFADYRDVNGMQFPFRLRRAVAGDTVEETIFDGFKINAKIDPKKFEAPK